MIMTLFKEANSPG